MKLCALPDGFIHTKRSYNEGKAFVFTVQTTGSPETFTLPLEVSGSYDFTVDWGDSSSDNVTVWNDAAVTHSYANAGMYTITIVGIIRGWRFNNGGDKTKIYNIKEWGPLRVGSNDGYFYGCSNLTVSATDTLNLTDTTVLKYFFRGCSSLTSLNVSAWDIANATTLHAAFFGCSSLTNLDVSAWNTTNVTGFNYVFRGCSSLVALDVSSWDVSNTTSLSGTFMDCLLLTTLALDNWDITAVTTMEDMLKNVTLITNNYSLILVAFEAQAVQNNVLFHAGNSQYYGLGFAATARAALIADHSWTITDGGIE